MTATRKPGRPRDEAVDAAVVEATLDLVEEDGLATVSMDAIAERAGVSKASIYRRWPGKGELLVDCVAGLTGDVQQPETGDIRESLVGILRQVRRFFAKAKAGQLFPWMVGEVAAGSDLGRRYAEAVILPRRAMMAEVLEAAVDRGELRTDLDIEVAVDQVTGPLVLEKLTGRYTKRGADWEERLVDELLRGWAP